MTKIRKEELHESNPRGPKHLDYLIMRDGVTKFSVTEEEWRQSQRSNKYAALRADAGTREAARHTQPFQKEAAKSTYESLMPTNEALLASDGAGKLARTTKGAPERQQYTRESISQTGKPRQMYKGQGDQADSNATHINIDDYLNSK